MPFQRVILFYFESPAAGPREGLLFPEQFLAFYLAVP